MHIILVAPLLVLSGATIQEQPAAPIEVPHSHPAEAAPTKIVMYRGSSIVGAGLACPIRFKGDLLVELARGKYAEWTVLPGRYILTNKTSSVEVAVDEGETRFVRCMIKPGMLIGRADLQIVDEESFNTHRSQFEQKPVLLPGVKAQQEKVEPESGPG